MHLDTFTDREFYDKYADIDDEMWFILKYLADHPEGEATEEELEQALMLHALARTVKDGYTLVTYDDKGMGLYRKNPEADFSEFEVNDE